MRLPISKVYRGFPELDGFTDAQCEAWLERVRRRLAGEGTLVALAAVVAVPCAWGLTAWAVSLIARLLAAVTGGWSSSGVEGPLIALAVVVVVMSGPVAALTVRDTWLRRAIVRQIGDTRCPGCRYSLLGLELVERGVKCPECGRRATLAELGLSAADLMAVEEPPNCAGCGYELEGLRWEGRGRRCPECGAVTGPAVRRVE